MSWFSLTFSSNKLYTRNYLHKNEFVCLIKHYLSGITLEFGIIFESVIKFYNIVSELETVEI